MGDSFRVRIGGEHSAPAEVARWRADLAALSWPNAPSSEPVWITEPERDGKGDTDALLLIDDDRVAAERAVDRGVSVVSLGGSFRPAPRAAGLRLPADAGPREVIVALAALAVRSREVSCLQHELKLATKVARGVESEIGRLDEELQMAAVLQQEFLPRPLPLIDGIEYAALWRPASSVSGDLYDIIRLDDRHIGLFLADAVGHGVPAALQAMMLCRALQTRDLHDRFHRLLSPGEALARLNCEMADRQARIGRYATALYAIIDCRTRVVRIASAGAPVPILFRAGGAIESVHVSGPLLGIAPQQTFDETVVELAPRDRMLLHSDGFERAFRDEHRPDDRLGPRYLDVLGELREQKTPAAMAEALGRRLDHEHGSLHQPDDCTMLVIRPKDAAAARAA